MATTDATTMLERQHREVEKLFDDFQHAHGQSKKQIVQQITEKLARHSAIEEQVFYPKLRDEAVRGGELADEALHDHAEVKRILADLERMGPDSPGYDDKVKALKENVEEHVREEEDRIFPRVRTAVDAETLSTMAQKMERVEKLAPTHPHPHAPDTPPANKVAGPVAGLIDKARDAIRGR